MKQIMARRSSQQILFNVHYLGRSSFPNCSTGEGVLQSSLFNKYVEYKTIKGTKKLSPVEIELSNQGLTVTNWTKDKEFYSLSSIVMCKAVIFTGSKTKHRGTKYYKYAFENLNEVGRGVTVNVTMDRSFKYLLKNKHPPIVVCILRREFGPRILEIHAFVCGNNAQAASFSGSVELARSTLTSEERKSSELFSYDPYEFQQNPISQPRQTNDPVDPNEPELAQIVNMLKGLGGNGSVINRVIKVHNVNLSENNKLVGDKSQRMKPNADWKSVRSDDCKNKVYQLNQEDFIRPQQYPPLSGHCRSSSFDRLSHLSIFQEDKNYQKPQPSKVESKHPVQRSISLKRDGLENIRQVGNRATAFPLDIKQNMISKDPSGGRLGENGKPNKPIATVHPHKVGVKVFPQGYDRTVLIPEKNKLKKVKNEKKPPSPTEAADRWSLYSAVNKPGKSSKVESKPTKSTAGDNLKKMQDVTS